jgi:tetratricopeptide (TPR) repeat protein
MHSGRLAEALALLDGSLRIHAGEPLIGSQWICLATVLRMLGRTDEALAAAQITHATGRRASGALLAVTGAAELGVIRQRLGHHRQAVLLLRWARNHLGPDVGPASECEARSYLGVSIVALGRVDEGLELLRAAYVDAEPLDPTTGCLVANNYAIGLRAAGRADEAKFVHAQTLERAMRIGYRYEQARAYLGLGLCTTDPRLARQRLGSALQLFELMGVPERHDVAAHLRSLDSIDAEAGK